MKNRFEKFYVFTSTMLLLAGWLFSASACHADMLWLKGEDRPQFGKVVGETSMEVLFIRFGALNAQSVNIARETIEVLVINIDDKRLERLSPANWAEYRDYAEELAIQKQDPAARELAIRLYLIAANGDDGDLRESCLTGMIALAENSQQRERWAMLKRFTSRLPDNTPAPVVEQVAKPDPVARERLLKIVRMIRQGRGNEAVRLLNESATETKIAQFNSLVSTEQLKRIATLNRMEMGQLQQLLRIELMLLEDIADIVPEGEKNWSTFSQLNATLSAEIPDFDNITPYDPEASIFRDGHWIQPN